MMSGYASSSAKSARKRRIYRVVAKTGGWAIVLDDACTFSFKDQVQAQRIAKNLQQQADALSSTA